MASLVVLILVWFSGKYFEISLSALVQMASAKSLCSLWSQKFFSAKRQRLILLTVSFQLHIIKVDIHNFNVSKGGGAHRHEYVTPVKMINPFPIKEIA